MRNDQSREIQSANTGLNDVVRQKLINRFVESNGKKYSEITESLQSGDTESARIMAHTLKSNAGQLGLHALQDAAGTVELQLKHGADYITPEQASALESELNAALAKLGPLVRENAPDGRAQPLEREAALDLLRKVELLLDDFDTDCVSLAGSLALIPGSEALIREIEDFNFEAASVSVKKLIDMI